MDIIEEDVRNITIINGPVFGSINSGDGTLINNSIEGNNEKSRLIYDSIPNETLDELIFTSFSFNIKEGLAHPFFGRENMFMDLHKIISKKSGNIIRRCSIIGMGGIGKSEFVKQYYKRYINEYKGGCFWIDCTKPLYEQIIDLSLILGLKFSTSDNELVRLNLVIKALNNRKSVLLIFDNVENDNISELKKIFIIIHCGIIVTCRDKYIAIKLELKPMEMERLSIEESLMLLSNYIGEKRLNENKSICSKLCNQLGGLPLALNLVGSYLEIEKDLSIEQYLNDFNIRTKIPIIDEELNICFDLSWHKLEENSKKIFLLICLLSSCFIRRDLILTLAKQYGIDEDTFYNGTDELIRYYFINRDLDGDFLIHNLLKRWGEIKLREEPKYASIKKIFECFLVDRAKELTILINDRDLIFKTYMIHLDIEDFFKVINGKEGVQNTKIITIYEFLGKYYEFKGMYFDAIKYYEKQLNLTIKVYSKYSCEVANSYSNLGTALGYQDKINQALDYHINSLKIRKKVFGKNNKETAKSYNNVGYMYYLFGKYKYSIKNYKKALRIRVSILGENHIDTAISFINMGQVYERLGKDKKAIMFYNKVEKIYNELGMQKYIDMSSLYNNIGSVYASLLKRYRKREYIAKALENYKKSLDLGQELLGELHPHNAVTYDNIGQIYSIDNKIKEALDSSQKALDIFINYYGEEHRDTALCYSNIGGIYTISKKYKKALEYNFIALKILEKVVGNNHPITAGVYSEIASIYMLLKEYNEAIKHYNMAIRILKKVLNIMHPDIINLRWCKFFCKVQLKK